MTRTLSYDLSLFLSLSPVSFFVLFTMSLSLPYVSIFRWRNHFLTYAFALCIHVTKTSSTRGTHRSNVPCAHNQWLEKPTPCVRRGFESQSRHVSRLAHNVRSCNGHIWSHLLAESKSEGARIRSASFAS